MSLQTTIDINSVRKQAPSIFATRAHSKMSDRYAFVPTSDIVDILVKDHNFNVVSAHQRIARRRDPKFTRHMIVMRPTLDKPLLGELIPQVLLTNSHDGQSKFQMRGGLFRIVCLNGLVTSVADTVCSKAHRGDPKVIIDAALAIVDKVGKVAPVVGRMMKKKLTDKQVKSFAIAASKISRKKEISFDPELLLAVRRPEDDGNTVWQVFNRIQENIMRGGVSFTSKASDRTFVTRGVTHIGRTIDLNTGLWQLAEKLAIK